jgi:hypothetical protein
VNTTTHRGNAGGICVTHDIASQRDLKLFVLAAKLLAFVLCAISYGWQQVEKVTFNPMQGNRTLILPILDRFHLLLVVGQYLECSGTDR